MMKERIRVEIGSNLPHGFTWRPATRDDAQTVTDLLNAESLVTVGKSRFSLEECYQEWSSPGFVLADSSCLVLDGAGRPAGYAELWDTDEVETLPFLLGAVHPEFWGRGVGTFLLAWGEKKARRVLARVPERYRAAMGAAAQAGNVAALRLFQDFGMAPIRTFYTMRLELDRPLEPPLWPEHIVVQDLETFGDAWAIYLAGVEAFEDHFGYAQRPEKEIRQDFEHRLADPDFTPDLWFVALDGRTGEIAGVSMCYPKADEDRTIGLVGKLGVRRPYRRQGIALALLRHSFEAFAGRPGYRAVQLGVDAGSLTNATQLYFKAGMSVLREVRLYEKLLREGDLLEKR